MLSHLDVLQRFLQTTCEYCLVFEDDCELTCDNFAKTVEESLRKIDPKFDLLLFGYHIDEDFHDSHKNNNKDIRYVDGFLKFHQFVGLHCYMLTRKGAQTVLDEVRSPSWFLDWEISQLSVNGKLNTYGVFPPVASQPAVHRIKVANIYYPYVIKSTFASTTNG